MPDPVEPLRLQLELTRAEQAGDPYAFRFGPQTYLVRSAGGGFANAELRWDAALTSDLAEARRPGGDPALLARLGELLRRFLEAAGWGEQLGEIMQAARQHRRVLLTVRSAAAELYALPWELCTLKATGQHLGELPEVLLRYEWPQSTTTPPPGPAGTPAAEGGRILLAWSAAGGAVPATEQLATIQQSCQAAGYAFDPDRDALPHASCGRLLVALQEARRSGKPIAMLHLLCHGAAAGSTFGLVLDGEQSGDECVVVDAGRLRQLLAPHADLIRLLVLHACDSGNSGALGNALGSVAQALHRAGFATIIASRYPLSVRGALAFSRSFYAALLEVPTSVETAYLLARQQLASDLTIKATPDWASLQLYARELDGEQSRPLVFRPFRGLLPFGPEHRRFYFGRDHEIDELLTKLRRLGEEHKPRLLVVAGASGTGKSSLVLAGALPALLDKSAGSWQIAVMRPGSAPHLALTQALAKRQDPAAPFALVIDQLEELFTHVADPTSRQQFIQALWQLASAPASQVSVLCTLRVDYLGRCGELWLEGSRLRLDQVAYQEAHRVFIAQQAGEQLRACIDGPLRQVGLKLEKGLGERLLTDAGNEPGVLPLLEDTLDLLWQARDGEHLTQTAYDRIGGVIGGLHKRADALVTSLPEGTQRTLRRLLVRLVSVGDDASHATRQRVPLRTLLPPDPSEAERFHSVLAALLAERLVVCDGEGTAQTVEVAHEALIRRWSLLQQWVRADRQMLLELQEVQTWVTQWKEHKTPLTGNLLGYAAELAARHKESFPAEARELLRHSQELDRKRRQRTRLVAAGFAVLAALAAGFGVFGINRSRLEAKARLRADQALLSESRANEELRREGVRTHDRLLDSYVEKAREALVERGDPVYALLVLQKAQKEGSQTFALRFLLAQAVYELDTLLLSAPGAAPAFSPDGRLLAIVEPQGHGVQVWEVAASKLLQKIPFAPGQLSQMVFLPGSTRMLLRADDGAARIVDAATGVEVQSVPLPPSLVALSIPNSGRQVLTLSGSDSDLVSLFELGDSKPRLHFTAARPTGGAVLAVAQSVDGKRVIVSGRNKAGAWLLRSGKQVWAAHQQEGHDDQYRAVYGPEQDLVARLESHGELVVVDASSGTELLSSDAYEPANGGVFVPASRWFLAAHTDAIIRRWAIPRAQSEGRAVKMPSEGRGPRRKPPQPALRSPDAEPALMPSNLSQWHRALEESADAHSQRLQNLEAENVPMEFKGLAEQVSAIAVSADGTTVAGGDLQGVVITWDIWTGQRLQTFAAHHVPIAGLAFSPDGTRLATADQEGHVKLWDTTHNALGRGLLRTQAQWQALIDRVGYDDDGFTTEVRGAGLVAKSAGSAITLLTSGGELRWEQNYSANGGPLAGAFTTSGNLLATWAAATRGTFGAPSRGVSAAMLWDVESGRPLRVLGGHAALLLAASLQPADAKSGPHPDPSRELLSPQAPNAQLLATLRCRLPIHLRGDSLTPVSEPPADCPGERGAASQR